MADYSTSTRLFVGQEILQAPPGDKFLRAVQRAVAGDFDVLGELGRGAKGKIVYLARETSSKQLVALQLMPGAAGQESGELWLDVLRKLDGSVPSAEGTCPRCGQVLRGWGRFCSQCGTDLSGVAPDSGANTSVGRLLDAVKQAAGERYEVLGQMDRSEGGGVVYFAREKSTSAIVALRLQKDTPAADGRERYNLGQTVMLKSMVSALLASDESEKSPAEEAPVAQAKQQAAAPTAPPARAPARTRQDQRVVFGVAAVLLLVLLGLWWTRGRQGPGIQVASDTIPQPPAVIDSAELQLGGGLPVGTVVTVAGGTVNPQSTRLPPGKYRVKVVAPGFAPVEQEIELKPGQTMLWTPQLAKASPRSVPKQARTTAPAPRPVPPSPQTQPQRPPPRQGAPVDTSPLPINQPPRPPRESIPPGPTATAGATCASLFSALEWSRALPACEREAQQGGTAAQRTLGTMYEQGLATEASPVEAGQWYAKAAESGDRMAQYRLGVLLRGDRGVKRDEKAAFKWFQRSAEQGETDAQLALAQAYDKGQGVKRSRTTAATWYLKAAESGRAEAQFRLGQFYEKGEAGLPESDVEARKWYKLAADQGHEEAREKLER